VVPSLSNTIPYRISTEPKIQKNNLLRAKKTGVFSIPHPERGFVFLFFPADPGQRGVLVEEFSDERCELLLPAFRALMKCPSQFQ
jgi:hypothetical protein